MKSSLTPFQVKVYEVVARTPKGKVGTYALVAKAIGKEKAVRAVGNALNKNPAVAEAMAGKPFIPTIADTPSHEASKGQGAMAGEPQVPCHLVVKSDGGVGGFVSGGEDKIKILRKE